jgi:hypothetical protein
LRTWQLQQFDGKEHVLQHRAPGQQNRALEHHADFPPRPGHFGILDSNFACGGIDQSGNHHQQGTLAATARTQHAQKLPVAHVERQLADRFEVAESLLESRDAHDRCAIAAGAAGS